MINYYELPIFRCKEYIIRALKTEAGIWFLGKDVCYSLGLKDEDLDEALFDVPIIDRKMISKPVKDDIVKETLINGNGVLLLCKKHNPKFKVEFKDWYENVLLPELEQKAREAATERFGKQNASRSTFKKKKDKQNEFWMDVNRYTTLILKKKLPSDQMKKLTNTAHEICKRDKIKFINKLGTLHFRRDVLDKAAQEVGL